MQTEETVSEEIEENEENQTLYPKFDLTDENGNPIRDARFYPFVSRVISAVNKTIAADYEYQHFE